MRVLILSATFLVMAGVDGRSADTKSRPTRYITCWQASRFLSDHRGDIVAARNAARARGYSEDEISDVMRRCG